MRTRTHEHPDRDREQKICVVLPTYNNAQTLADVLKGTLNFTDHVFVVNDGSTDNTEDIVREFPQVKLISYPTNQGKGHALRKGFKAALDAGAQAAPVSVLRCRPGAGSGDCGGQSSRPLQPMVLPLCIGDLDFLQPARISRRASRPEDRYSERRP